MLARDYASGEMKRERERGGEGRVFTAILLHRRREITIRPTNRNYVNVINKKEFLAKYYRKRNTEEETNRTYILEQVSKPKKILGKQCLI